MKRSGFTNKEANKLLGISDYHDTVTKPNPIADEIKVKRNILWDIPMPYTGFINCISCIHGLVRYDIRLKHVVQYRVCDNCKMPHDVRVDAGNKVKYKLNLKRQPSVHEGELGMSQYQLLINKPVRGRQVA